MNIDQLNDKILGCLVGSAMGDAIGAPSEALSQDEILKVYGKPISRFIQGIDSIYTHGNNIAEVTDDSSQMYELAKTMVECDGNITPLKVGEALVRWSKLYPKYYPRNAGPTTQFAINELEAGKDPKEIGQLGGIYQRGTSNGAAMRIAAAGLVNPGDLNGAVETAIIMTLPTHGTQHAYSGACAIACGIAEGLKENSDVHSVLKAISWGAKEGERRGLKEARIACGLRVPPQINEAISIAYDSESMQETLRRLDESIGNDTSIQQAVGTAVGIFTAADGNIYESIKGGANVGGDTDTIACIAGSLAGALNGFTNIPVDLYKEFKEANPKLDFESVAKALSSIAYRRMKG